MAATTVQQPAKPQLPPQKQKWFSRRKRWIFGGLAALVAAAIVYITLLILNWPFTEQAVIDVLQERSVRSVTVDHFYKTYWPPGCVAEGIRFLHRKHKNKPPLITIQTLVIKSSYTRLLTVSYSVSKVIVRGMHVAVPPPDPNGGPNPVMPLTYSDKAGPSMVIGRIVADGAVLDFLSRDPKQKPFRLGIDKLSIDGVGNNAALPYHVILSNSLPPGKIISSGVFGPWNAKNPASTPVKGSYTYQNANLAVFSDVSGTLSASGKFNGILGRIETTGTAAVPNFQLKDTSHTRKLSTEFRATVDGTKGDTTLENVVAHFDRTTLVVSGSVAAEAGESGKGLSLNMFVPIGRIEDLLDLFISAKRAPMSGSVTFRAHADVPPGPDEFIRKLRLVGDFGVGSGKFTDIETQRTINRLSEGGKGKQQPGDNDETALSQLRCHVVAKGGIATLSSISFRVPDATAHMEGTYGLTTPYPVDLHGNLLTDHPSNAETGFKSFLLKAITPFLKKKGRAKILPFKMTGTYERTQIGLDMARKK